ncbi:MAG: ribonuclease J [Candidatus Nanohalarchaeota archaeon]|nr:MAG: ribonuclease J [Candidatus Nanohaloarchaeota archaeon]
MKFYAIGGYNEVGKNMSAVEINGEVVILDMGVYMDKIITLEEEDRKISTKEMIQCGALPDDHILEGKNIAAIVLSHGHLDHIAAVPRMAERYKCPIIATPYTCEILKNLLKDAGVGYLIKSLFPLSAGETASISHNFEVEFIHMTHSIPHTALIALHTKEGIIAYLNDYKLDNNPTLGEKPDYKRIKQLGKQGVKVLVSECVRVADEARTPPEYVAQVLVEDAIDRAYEENTAVVITTFASQIARINSIIKANKNQREIIMLGRALGNYLVPASRLGLINLKNIKIFNRQKSIAKALIDVQANPENYLMLATGNQGEPNAILSRMSRKEYEFRFRKEDQVIFSSEVIPNPLNESNRYTLDQNLREQGVRMLQHVHVSGHARREDHRDMLRMINPEYVFPNHGETERLASYASLAMDEGYRMGDSVKVLYNGAVVDL